MKYSYLISIVTENRIRVLQRMAGIFARNRLNVEHMNLFSKANGVTYFNIAIKSDTKTIERVIKQLRKIIELLEIKINYQIPEIENQLAEDSECQQCNLGQSKSA